MPGMPSRTATARRAGQRPWLSGSVALTGRLGSPQTTALVEPRAFTTGLMRAAEAEGAELRSARSPIWRAPAAR